MLVLLAWNLARAVPSDTGDTDTSDTGSVDTDAPVDTDDTDDTDLPSSDTSDTSDTGVAPVVDPPDDTDDPTDTDTDDTDVVEAPTWDTALPTVLASSLAGEGGGFGCDTTPRSAGVLGLLVLLLARRQGAR